MTELKPCPEGWTPVSQLPPLTRNCSAPGYGDSDHVLVGFDDGTVGKGFYRDAGNLHYWVVDGVVQPSSEARLVCWRPARLWNTRTSEREAIAEWLEERGNLDDETLELLRAGRFEGGE